jgi:hypothetical protein
MHSKVTAAAAAAANAVEGILILCGCRCFSCALPVMHSSYLLLLLLLLLLQIPEDINAVQVPLQFICAASDAQFPEKTRTAAQQLLHQKSPGGASGRISGCVRVLQSCFVSAPFGSADANVTQRQS